MFRKNLNQNEKDGQVMKALVMEEFNQVHLVQRPTLKRRQKLERKTRETHNERHIRKRKKACPTYTIQVQAW